MGSHATAALSRKPAFRAFIRVVAFHKTSFGLWPSTTFSRGEVFSHTTNNFGLVFRRYFGSNSHLLAQRFFVSHYSRAVGMWHAGNDGTGTLAQPAQAEGANSFPPPPPPLLPVTLLPRLYFKHFVKQHQRVQPSLLALLWELASFERRSKKKHIEPQHQQ